MGTFSIGKNAFYLDEKPFRILSGAVHYFRVPRAYWRDSLHKLKLCGFNTVETYVAWNAHMPDENTFLFDGEHDLSAFLDIAQELGLYAIVRPGPYICSEWEFGGLPWWLLKEDMCLRCSDPAYLRHVDHYFELLLPRIRKNFITNGGNVIMMQVENEYGSFGDDTTYLVHLMDKMRSLGVDVPLFTSDGPTDCKLTGGGISGVLRTGNFGAHPDEKFQKLREHQPDGPLMCMEFWNGWFDHWGEEHHMRDPVLTRDLFKEMLDAGASVNAYMFHGGTNFGFMSGANCPERYEYQPTVTSYDNDALLTEWGDITPKYKLIRELLKSYSEVPDEPLPPPRRKTTYGKVTLTRSLSLPEVVAGRETFHNVSPRPMEKYGQGYGYILYSAFIRGPREERPFFIQEVRDRAHVFLNGKLLGIVQRNETGSQFDLAIPPEGARIDILVENMGRVNYGPYMHDPKGITEGVRMERHFLHNWDITPLHMEDVSGLPYREGVPTWNGMPMFLSGEFDAGDEPEDTFVKLPGFRKGVIFINGRPLSRYWEIGPQMTAYLPAPFMKKGINTLTVFETDGFDVPEAILTGKPELGSNTVIVTR